MRAHEERRWARWALLAGALPVLSLGLGCGPRSDAGPIRLSGNIEATEAQLSFKVAGRVTERAVDEGQAVKAGQLVARLDDRELAQEVARLHAQAEVARAQLREVASGYRPEEVAQAEAAAEAAKAEAERADADLVRQKALVGREVISQREFDASRSVAEASAARLRQAREYLNLLQKGYRSEKIEAARAALKQAEAAQGLAETRLAETRIVSPLDGVVLSKAVEPGEYVSPGTPVVNVADLSKVWLRAYVEEVDLGRVKLGQAVAVKTDTHAGKIYPGRVSYISAEAEFTPKTVQTKKERVRLVYRVKIDLENPARELKPGMPADAEIAEKR
jgi:HlyD family secretion protein